MKSINKNKDINIGKCYGPWGTFSVKQTGLGKDNNLFSGAVAVGDKVVFVPLLSSKVGIYDVNLDSFSTKETGLSGDYKFWGGVAVGDKVVFAPYNSSKVGIYDVNLDSFSTKETGLPLGMGLFSGAITVGDKVVFVPLTHRKWGFTMLH